MLQSHCTCAEQEHDRKALLKAAMKVQSAHIMPPHDCPSLCASWDWRPWSEHHAKRCQRTDVPELFMPYHLNK
jgi:hypothetical protein